VSKTTLHNFEAPREVREPRDELSEAELKTVSGGIIFTPLLKRIAESAMSKLPTRIEPLS
jgi:bacteriocin-like protein